MILGGLSLPLVLFGSLPVLIFGFAVGAWTGKAARALFILAGSLIGIGLLRFKPLSHTLAVGFYAVSIANAAGQLVNPGSLAGIASAMGEVFGQETGVVISARLLWFSSVFGLLFSALLLWLLLSRRNEFLEACRATVPVPMTALSN